MNKKRAISILECLIGMTIFLIAIFPIWDLMNSAYGTINVTNDDLVANIVSTCLISEYGNKDYVELSGMIPSSPLSENNIYDTNINAEVIITKKTSELNYYDFIEIEIKLKQKVIKPKPKINEFKYTVSVPRVY